MYDSDCCSVCHATLAAKSSASAYGRDIDRSIYSLLNSMDKEKSMMEQQTTPVALKETAVQELVARMRGELLRPSDAGYEQAIRVYNGMIEKRPALIARCVDVADVIAAVNFAREHELTLAVRGGGHSGPGLGTCDDGLGIDPSGMKGIRLHSSARTPPPQVR